MAYPIINGAAINEVGAPETEGIDLIGPNSVGLVQAFAVVFMKSALAEFGTPMVQLTLKPDGIDLVTVTPHVITFNTPLYPPGLDLLAYAPSVVAGVVVAGGYDAMEYGAHKVQSGFDVELQSGGIDLVRYGLVIASKGMPPNDREFHVPSSFPMEFGDPAVSLADTTVFAVGSTPMEFGTPGSGRTMTAISATPMEFGATAVGQAVRTIGSFPMEFGMPSQAESFPVLGIDLLTTDRPNVGASIHALVSGGYMPLELGTPGQPTGILRARQSFPFEMGRPAVDRGATC